ncbi:MAG: hypothetical protein R3C30_06740 [Hyphomonadaceae bacterium]
MFIGDGSAEAFDASEVGESDYFAATNRGAGEYDFCSRSGAQELKAKIEAYWAERGQQVQVMLHNVGFHPAIRAARYDVRSDMINGMPRATSVKRTAPAVEAFVEDFDASEDDLVFE